MGGVPTPVLNDCNRSAGKVTGIVTQDDDNYISYSNFAVLSSGPESGTEISFTRKGTMTLDPTSICASVTRLPTPRNCYCYLHLFGENVYDTTRKEQMSGPGFLETYTDGAKLSEKATPTAAEARVPEIKRGSTVVIALCSIPVWARKLQVKTGLLLREFSGFISCLDLEYPEITITGNDP
ncbi:hypothetical protein NQ315_006348 [Exocentrus adspersus]|uniref:Uncharacterized protein n=1 Tax=Exocentrus adspersus TaxID=1586481 RepID=A0AAV8VZY8_9CUCU|nr:hypothetical protein NQ315_006348 [Exocentrus adspersus]